MKLRRVLPITAFALALFTLTACGGFGRRARADLDALWNFKALDSLTFMDQEKEREFSALASDSDALYLISERRGKILRAIYPVGPTGRFDELALWTREEGEYEGAAIVGEHLYLVDERSDPGQDVAPLLVKVRLRSPEEQVASYPLRFTGLDCAKGDCFEGLAVYGGKVYLLDELDHLPGGGCAGRLYVTTLAALEAGSLSQPASLSLPLPNCQWRYTDVYPTPIGERVYLLALKTYCSWNQEAKECDEDQYVVELIDPEVEPKVVSSYHFPEVQVGWWRMANVSRNLEGIAIGPDGSLYIVSDNRWTNGRQLKSLLLRIPKR